MKKDVFNVWIKEFCSLVFTQTVQAFLLTAVMTVIMSSLGSGNTADDQGIDLGAAGVIAIVALASLNKIEVLVKKIFGVESQFGDPSMKNGMGTLASSLIAAKLAGRALNNVPKIAGAFGDRRDAKKAALRAKQRYNRDIGLLAGNSGSGSSGNSNSGAEQKDDPKPPLIPPKDPPTPPEPPLDPNEDRSKAKQKSASSKPFDMEKYNKIRDNYEDAISASRQKKRDAFYKGLSGVAETASIPFGAAAGLAYGLGTGSDVVKSMASGVGISDAVAGTAVSGVNSISTSIHGRSSLKNEQRETMNTLNETAKKIIGNDAKQYKSFRLSSNKQQKNIEKELRKKITASDIE